MMIRCQWVPQFMVVMSNAKKIRQLSALHCNSNSHKSHFDRINQNNLGYDIGINQYQWSSTSPIIAFSTNSRLSILLYEENVFVMTTIIASLQEIPPLKVLNLMLKKLICPVKQGSSDDDVGREVSTIFCAQRRFYIQNPASVPYEIRNRGYDAISVRATVQGGDEKLLRNRQIFFHLHFAWHRI